MARLRAFFSDHRRIAALLLAMALVLKALVPAGYMLAANTRTLTIEICADASGGTITQEMVIPASGQPHAGKAAKSGDACPYGALAMASLGATPPALLALALLFILALGFAPVHAPRPRPVAHLRPPLRGPPLPA